MPSGGVCIDTTPFSVCRRMAAVVYRYWYQSTRTPRGCDVWPASTLELLDDTQVSFDGGALHGAWEMHGTELVVDFHWEGRADRTKVHTFQSIANTSTYILTRVGWRVRTDLILVPMLGAAGDGGHPGGNRPLNEGGPVSRCEK